ncbi:MAG: DUF3598 family protein [Synechococcales bacterium]|nr:DUF3598 family protein [Synechococcales bacterium]
MNQWDQLLLNLGIWEGSFTRLSPNGDPIQDEPSCVTLEGLDENRRIRQTIQRFSPDGTAADPPKVLEYATLGRGVCFFDTGAFSQGSIQYGPFSEFGAEFGFLAGDRRLRLVQLFDREARLAQITLIREKRQGTAAPERPPLTVSALVGTWQGEATTLYADLRNPEQAHTSLTIQQQGDRLIQTLQGPGVQFSSSAQINGSRLHFEQGYPSQVLLLPDGASSHTPLTVPRDQSFLLEAGWLITPTLRQRLIRRYDARGTWISLTLVVEQKVA